MIAKTLEIKGKTLNRVSKTKARQVFNADGKVLLIRNNTRPNPWMPFYGTISKADGNVDFDKSVNAYEYYNHEPELGNRTEFYI